MDDVSDRELLDALGVEITSEKQAARTPREERIIAGFEEIQRFYEEHGRGPLHGEDRDIFERLYAVRLDRLRELDECRTLLEPLDHQGLLNAEVQKVTDAVAEDVEDAELLAMLGVAAEASDITHLRHVRSSVEKRAAEEVSSRQSCADFALFKPLFAQVQQDLDTGIRSARPFGVKAEIEPGRFFILGGQKVYVAEMGEVFMQEYGDKDARLRVIFDNGTESIMTPETAVSDGKAEDPALRGLGAWLRVLGAWSGTPLNALQELGGWESPEMVQRYAHMAPEHLSEHASRIETPLRTFSGTPETKKATEVA